jgi:hypothetical protein
MSNSEAEKLYGDFARAHNVIEKRSTYKLPLLYDEDKGSDAERREENEDDMVDQEMRHNRENDKAKTNYARSSKRMNKTEQGAEYTSSTNTSVTTSPTSNISHIATKGSSPPPLSLSPSPSSPPNQPHTPHDKPEDNSSTLIPI